MSWLWLKVARRRFFPELLARSCTLSTSADALVQEEHGVEGFIEVPEQRQERT